MTYNILYSYKDLTFTPSIWAILFSQIGLVLFFVMIFSFIDLKTYFTMKFRFWLMGVSIFGMLQFLGIWEDYRDYKLEHNSYVNKTYYTIEGKVDYFTENNRGWQTFYVAGRKFETGIDFPQPISNGDSVKIKYYGYDNSILEILKKKNKQGH